MRRALVCLLLTWSHSAVAQPLTPIDVNAATVEQLHARLPARLVEPITKYRAFYKGRFESVDQVIDALSEVGFGAAGCAAKAPCPDRLTDAERATLRAVLRVNPE